MKGEGACECMTLTNKNQSQSTTKIWNVQSSREERGLLSCREGHFCTFTNKFFNNLINILYLIILFFSFKKNPIIKLINYIN